MLGNSLVIILAVVIGGVAGVLLNHWFHRKPSATDPAFEVFKNRAAGIQSCLLSIAIIFGGSWTFYTFVVRDVLKSFEEADINIEIAAREEVLLTGQLCVSATVKITNTGKRNVFLDYRRGEEERKLTDPDYLFSITNSFTEERGTIVASSLPLYRVLRSGETTQYSIVATAPSTGVYVLYFSVPLPGPELEIHNRIASSVRPKLGKTGPISWEGSTVINVSGGQAANQVLKKTGLQEESRRF